MKRFLQALLHYPAFVPLLLYHVLRVSFQRLCGRRCIVYNMHHDYFLDAFVPVLRHLDSDPRMRVFISCPDDAALVAYVKATHGAARLLPSYVSPFVPFNLFLTAELTGPDMPARWLRTPSVVMYHGTGVYDLWSRSEVVRRFDAHCAVGPQFRETIEELSAGWKRRPRIYNVGYPKTDALARALAPRASATARPVVLFAPHWAPTGTLHVFGDELIEMLSQYPVDIVVKVHHYLFTKYPQMRWQERLAGWETRFPRVTIGRIPSTQEYYPTASLLVTDTGTTAGLEYSLLGKPLAVHENRRWFDGRVHAEVEAAILDAAFTFSTTEQLGAIVKATLVDQSNGSACARQREAQQALVQRFLYNPGTAASAAFNAICSELRL